MMRIGLFIIAAIAAPLFAQDVPTVALWPKGMPEPKAKTTGPEKVEKGKDGTRRRLDVSEPRLFVFEAPAEKRSGVGVIVVPGGGFGRLADEHEGSDACLWLNKLGITSFLLVHRCPTDKEPDPAVGPMQDAQRAVQLIRRKAADWKLDPAKIGLLGFSAGGQVAARAAANPWQAEGDAAEGNHKPDFLLLIYPWRIYDAKTKALRAEIPVGSSFPPTFLAQCGDDAGSLPQGSTLLYLELINRKIPAELHIYERGGHGFGMQSRANATGPSDWPLRAADWLRLRGLTK
jgi:acetyl esterase/lipase